jgi:hypothetical protein
METYLNKLHYILYVFVLVLEKTMAGPMPTGCLDLKQLGHLKNGFYMIKAPSNNKLLAVYCDFTKEPRATGLIHLNVLKIYKYKYFHLQGVTIIVFVCLLSIGFETVIGFNDIKTASAGVSFYVQRQGPYSYAKTVIPYQVERLNIGGAMNLATGVFTVPVNGRYHFSFAAISMTAHFNMVNLRVNAGVNYIGSSWATSTDFNLPIVATLNLKKGDTVDTYLAMGSISDSQNLHTQFSGILLEEDLSL